MISHLQIDKEYIFVPISTKNDFPANVGNLEWITMPPWTLFTQYILPI